MSEQDVFSFSVKADVEVEKSSMDSACRTLDNFYNKYNNKKLKIDTKDMVKAAQDGIGKIQKLYAQGMNEAAKDGGISWWQVEDGLESQLADARGKLEEFFNEAKLIFSDGSIFSVLDDNLTNVLSEKFQQGITVIAADLGERVQYLKQQISSIFDDLENIGAVGRYSTGQIFSLSEGEMYESQLEKRIELIKELAESQKELELFEGSTFTSSNSPVGMSTKQLELNAKNLTNTLEQLRDYNSLVEEEYEITTKQLTKRNNLIKSANNNLWGEASQQYAKDNISDNEIYEQNIQDLKDYIQQKKQLIESFESNEDELFRADGIEKYVNQVKKSINEYQGYIKELETLKNGQDNATVAVDFSGVVEQLKQIREVIEGIKEAFKPLTDALSSENSALSAMVKANISDLERLDTKVNETFENIKKLSNKDFNVTQNFTTSNATKGSNSIEEVRKQAQQACESINLINDAIAKAFSSNKGLNREVGSYWTFFAENAANFAEENYGDRINSVKTAETLNKYIVSLTAYKNKFMSVVDEINKIKPGAIDLSKIFADSVEQESKENKFTIDSAEMSIEETLAKVKSARQQITTEFSQIEDQIKNIFDFSQLNPDYSHISAITDNIYQYFIELKNKINTLDFNIPAIVTKVDADGTEKIVAQTADDSGATKSTNAISSEAQAMDNVANKADTAAEAKNKFTNANKKVADSASSTVDDLKQEQQELEKTAESAQKASNDIKELDKITDKINHTTQVSSHAEEKTTDYNTVKTTVTRDAENNIISETTTFIQQLKARRDAVEKEAAKIKGAQADLENFFESFDNKTNNMGKHLNGYDYLKNTFKIDSLKDIDEAITLMTKLDAEYNKVTKSFRQGTKSMNPFVNAITGIGEMENKVLNASIAFEKLTDKPEKLKQQIDELTPLFSEMQSYIVTDANGDKSITDIYKFAEAYGKLNAALRQANADISTQSALNQLSHKDTMLRLKVEGQLNDIIKQRAQWNKNGQLTDDLDIQLNQMFESLGNIDNDADLSAWTKQWGNLKKEVMATKYEMEAAKKAEDEVAKKDTDAAIAQYDEIMKVLDSKNKALSKMMSAKGATEQGIWAEEYNKWNEKWNNFDQEALSDFFADAGNQAMLGADRIDKFNDSMRESELLSAKMTDNQVAQETTNLENAIKLQDKLYKLKKQLSEADAGSAKGQQLTREINGLQEEYDTAVKLLTVEENRLSLKERQAQLEKELTAAQNNYGKTVYNQESKYYDKIDANEKVVLDLGLELSSDFTAKLNEYKTAFKELEDLRNRFATDPNAAGDSALEKQFSEAALKVEKLRTEVTSTFKEIQKFQQLSNSGTLINTQHFEASDLSSAKAAMIEYGAAISNGQLKFEGFNAACTEMYGTLDTGAGSIQKVTVAMLEGTNTMYAYQSGTKQVSNSWQQLGTDLTNGVKHIVSMYFGFHEAIQAIRQGVTYVKEIDLAMTELKKVTDETDETYNNFLTTASKTASVIGSTVSDFTDATSNFARLGYSIDESAKMAETAIVYKNVADGLDTVEESTESIISTMMAYGIEANDTMGIIDRFNAVGNNFAITSAGIGEAMQRSASALNAGGNTIDESIALITAANSVIQNPEQVGTALKTLTLRLRGAKTELEEAGLDAEDMVETTSELRDKLLALTHGKVDIMIDANTFKNTTQILREMSYAWQDMTDIEQAAALELMGGRFFCHGVQKCA